MLLVGTNRMLMDLDRSFTIAEDASVTALAAAGSSAFAMLDAERVDRIEEFDCEAVATLPEPHGQSVAIMNSSEAPRTSSPSTAGHHLGHRQADVLPSNPLGHRLGHHPDESSHAVESPNFDLLVGMSGARLVRVTSAGDAEPISSFESVPGRPAWENPAGDTPDTRSLAVAEDGQWLVNIHVGGLWASEDEGGSWAQIIEPEADIHEVTAVSGRLAVAAAVGAGWSEDSGLTWHWSTDGLAASYARAVAIDGDSIYVSASTGPSTTAGALYRATLGHRFEKCTGGLPDWFPFNIDTASLAARDGRVVFGTRDGRVFESRDEGSSWTVVAEHLGVVSCVKLG